MFLRRRSKFSFLWYRCNLNQYTSPSSAVSFIGEHGILMSGGFPVLLHPFTPCSLTFLSCSVFCSGLLYLFSKLGAACSSSKLSRSGSKVNVRPALWNCLTSLHFFFGAEPEVKRVEGKSLKLRGTFCCCTSEHSFSFLYILSTQTPSQQMPLCDA